MVTKSPQFFRDTILELKRMRLIEKMNIIQTSYNDIGFKNFNFKILPRFVAHETIIFNFQSV
jgi:hypothetical protein